MQNRHVRALETPWAWGLSFLVAAVVALVGAAVGGTGHLAVMVALFAVPAAMIAVAAPLAAAPLVAGTCWCFYDGFFVNRHGQLALRPTDLRPLALLAVAALLGWAAGQMLRRGAARPVRTAEDNPLRRSGDLARDRLRRRQVRFVVLAAALGIGVGAGAYAQQSAAAEAVRASGHRVTATTLAAAATSPTGRAPRGGGAPLLVRVPVRWQYPIGVRHETIVPVRRGSPPGTRVTVWVNRSGNPLDIPADAADVFLLSAFVALGVAGTGALVVAGGTSLARRRLDRRDWQAWERDWARVEPDWSGRRRNHGVG